MFDENRQTYETERLELRSVLSPEEYESARSGVLNAHYTDSGIIFGIYDSVKKIGFEYGNILDIKTPRLIQFNYSSADFAA